MNSLAASAQGRRTDLPVQFGIALKLKNNKKIPGSGEIKRLQKSPRGGGGGTWVNFYWVCVAGLLEPLPHYNLYIIVTFGQICNFGDPSLATFYFYELTHFRLNEEHFAVFTFRLHHKHEGG